MIQKNKQKRGIAIIQVALLIVSIFAIAYILSSQIYLVNATPGPRNQYCGGEPIGEMSSAPSCVDTWNIIENSNYVELGISCEDAWQTFGAAFGHLLIDPENERWPENMPDEGEEVNGLMGMYCGGQGYGIIESDNHEIWLNSIDGIPSVTGNNCEEMWDNFMETNPQCEYYETHDEVMGCGGQGYIFNVELQDQKFALDKWECISNYIGPGFTQDCDAAQTYFDSIWNTGYTYDSADRKCRELTDPDIGVNAPTPLPTSRNPTPPVMPPTVEIDGETYTQNTDGTYTDGTGSIVTAENQPELYQRIGDKVAIGLEANAAKEITSTLTGWIKRLLGLGEKETIGKAGGELLRKATGNPSGSKAIFKSFFDASTIQGTAVYATAIYFGTKWIVGNVLGQDENTANAWATGLTAGFVAYQALSSWGAAASFLGPYGVAAAALAVTATTIWLMLQKEDTKTIAFSCQAWQPEIGGENCERCNDYGALGCTEYQCRSLGVACSLVNQGTPDQKCFWNNSENISPPKITVWDDVLRTGYSYTPIDAQTPIDRGAKIVADTEDGCVPAFSIFDIGIQLDQFGSCRIDHRRGLEFNDMLPYGFGGSAGFSYNHSQAFMFPGGDNLRREGIEVPNGGEYKFYVKCMSANGYISPADFEFQFCIHDGPDMMAPIIYGTNEGSDRIYAPHNASSIDLQVYVNEPSECKWDFVDKEYEEMINTMSCGDGGNLGFNGQVSYPCDVTLDSIQDDQDNNYYFRCLDQPDLAGTDESGKRHAMTHSYPFTILGTKSLAISSVGPDNETIIGSTSPIRVTLTATTAEGADSGNAWCQYSDSGDFGTYMPFTNTGSYSHSTEIRISPGNKEYFIQCYDLGSNFVTKTTNFTVESDKTPSIVVRAYKDDPYLKIITDEAAECVYSIHPEIQCGYSFDEGIAMTDINSGLQHYVTWQAGSTFYMKCKDGFGNEPGYDACSVIIKPFDI